ncbi:MAG: ABC transporter permease [Candidatus Ratteibacteria bacterium]|nr:ABC transporter permease [Candidatus Ratteibacteria bacterium]
MQDEKLEIKNRQALTHKARHQEFRHIFKKNKLALFGMAFLVFFFLFAIAGAILTYGRDPLLNPSTVRLADKLKPPFSLPNRDIIPEKELPRLGIYLWGTDNLGRDIFARMLQGAVVSLSVGFVAVGISVFIGMFIGGIGGYFSKVKILKIFTVDTLITRLIDVMLCFPVFFLILTLIAILPGNIWIIMVVIGITGWTGTARFVRAEFLSLKNQDFVIAAEALGIPGRRIIFKHMMPNAIAPVLVSATIGIPTAILTESALSFLGFGVQPPNATWGNILASGTNFIFDAPWITFIPGIAILLTVLSFNLFGEWLSDALNPKLRKR